MGDGGERLRIWRKRRGLSQAEVAAMVGVKQATVSDWEKKKKTPDVDNVVAVQRVTEGEVVVEAWVSDPPNPPAPESGPSVSAAAKRSRRKPTQAA